MKYKLHALAAAWTVGLLWALALFIWTLVTVQNGYGEPLLMLMAEVYPYYEVSMVGAFWGLLWGFLDGFIGAYVFVWVYNFFVGMFSKK